MINSPIGKKSYKNILNQSILGKAFGMRTTRNTSLKDPLEHVLRTIGHGENQSHNRSKSELYNTILGFYESNANMAERPTEKLFALP